MSSELKQAAQPAEVTDEQIESCALEAGFSVESTGSIWAVDGYVGTRVDPGLRKFAKALLALRPAQVPMTDAVAEAVVTEREACAQACDAVKGKSRQHLFRSGAAICAGVIRARSITAQAEKEGA
jgi:hypothetical protein